MDNTKTISRKHEEVKAVSQINENDLKSSTAIGPAQSGYFISDKGLNRLTDVINEVPTRYGMVLIKILQEELKKRD